MSEPFTESAASPIHEPEAGEQAETARKKDQRHPAAGKALKTAFPYTIPVMAGYVFLGLTYGVLMSTSGFPFIYPMLTALVVYTGSMEFLLVSILLSSFNPISAFATALMVGARHLFYGISMLPKYQDMGWKKFYLIFATSDETFSINYSAEIPEDIDKGWFYFWVSFLDQLYWVAGSAVGGIFGSLISFDTRGLDFVMTAMFVVIFLQQWMKDKNHFSELLGLAGSALCLKLFGPDRFIIPSMIVIFSVLTLMRKKLEKKEDQR